MKNKRFIILLVLLMAGMATMQAQQLEPIIAEGKQWNVVLTYVPWPPINRVTDAYKLEGDTVVDGTTYKKLLTTQSEQYDNWGLWGLLRETNERQVFSRKYRWNHTFESETLLYDFSIEPGDSICYGESSCLLLLRKSDTILDDGTVRKRYDFQYKDGGYLMDEYETWIEGIGSEYGLLHSGSRVLVGGIYDLLCYYEDEDPIWQNPQLNSCYINTHSGGTIGTTFLDEESSLYYTIISTNPPCVSVDGHVNAPYPTGELNIPETVTWQGINYTVTLIKNNAFEACSGLTGNLVIPNTVTEIGERAFGGCDGFTGDLVIPNSVRTIGNEAFADCRGFNGTLVLPDSMEVIQFKVFSGCTGLTGTLTIPNSVTEIEVGAFYGCSGFTGDLVIPNSVKRLGFSNEYTPYGVFSECEGFDGHLILPDSLEVIGIYCFDNCSNLSGELLLPNTIMEIQRGAFQDCSGLTGTLVLPENLNYIGLGSFSGCSGLSGSLVIPNSVIEIQQYAFSGLNHLTSVSIPNSVVSILNGAFHGCSALSSVSMSENVTEIAESLFDHCTNLSEIVLPDGITAIRRTAFSHCESLGSITIPQSCDTIGEDAFTNCRNLTSVDFSEGLLSIGMDAFFGCDKLERVVIPNSVVNIGQMAFIACSSLSYLVIGSSVESIGREAFWSDSALDTIVSMAAVPPTLAADAFPPLAYQTVSRIVVPCGFKDDYLLSDWTRYFSEDTFVEDCGSGLIEFHGSEWYYEIVDEYGNVTYQHLEYVADTTVNHKDVQIIIRTNTLYDKGEHQEVTREYLYMEDNLVYWWNSELEEFTVLYDLSAQQGDSWVIKVGTETLTMHVDAVNQYYYEGQTFRMLRVSDEDDLFSGTIVCGVGHLSSFFPERLMTRGKGYRVQGLRCYWNYGNLLFTVDRDNCDAIYANLHNGIDEPTALFALYPNPTHNVLFVETQNFASLQNQTYHITNLMGQTLMTGQITAENQQIDVSNLPEGTYFITIGDMTRKFVVR